MSPARVTAGGLPISRMKPGPAHGQHASWPADHLCFTRLTGCPPGVFKPCPWSRQCSLGRCPLVEWLRTLRPREGKGYSQGHTARLVPLPLQKPRELARPGQRPPPTVNPCSLGSPHLICGPWSPRAKHCREQRCCGEAPDSAGANASQARVLGTLASGAEQLQGPPKGLWEMTGNGEGGGRSREGASDPGTGDGL